MCQHASWGAPTPLLDVIMNYVHKRRELSERSAIIERAKKVHDDGYACKLVSSLAPGELMWEISEKFRIKGRMWLQLGNMGMDVPFRPLCI